MAPAWPEEPANAREVPAREGSAADRGDVLIVSLGSTAGLRRADEELRASLERAGVRVEIVSACAPRAARTLMLTDLGWARAARKATLAALARRRGMPRPAIVYSSTTAALLSPRPGTIRFDATAVGNRPGRHGMWQRPLERHRLGQAPLLLPWSDGALQEAPAVARDGDRALVVPVPVEPSGPVEATRDIATITYAANPTKKGLDRVLAAWRAVHATSAAVGQADELVVAGASLRELELAGHLLGREQGVRVVGALPAADYRALLRRARVFVSAPSREDYGLAQLEALADGCLLATTPAPGPYAALPIARALDARLVSEDLQGALRQALYDPPAEYQPRALKALARFSRATIDALVAQQLLPRLLALSG